jgi:hypothetical protein
MLNHCVFFWAKDNLSASDRHDFEQGLRSLLAIPYVDDGNIGVPAAVTERPSVDRSYTFALQLKFADIAAHDAYQIDPVHKAFHERCVRYWSKAVVYDFVDPDLVDRL